MLERQCKRRRTRNAPQNRVASAEARNFFVYNAFRMLRFLSAGESHGQALVITLDGMPAGLDIDMDALNAQLRRRQGGYGRGRRMAIESDRAEILAGVRHGCTTGAPIAMLIRNRDWVNWQQTMYVEREMPEGASGTKRPDVTRPRPGHADLAGAVKYGHEDIRDVIERASARETASRVAAGSLARQLLGRFGIRIASHVSSIGDIALAEERVVSFDEARAIDDEAPLRCVDSQLQQKMIAVIDAAKDAGDTVGGSFEVIATGVPPGLGSYVQWDRKLDGRLAQALMCIHAIKGVGIGIGPEAAFRPGSRVHDEILPPRREANVPVRPTNRAGGLEGGVTNGEDLRVTGFMKPIATLMKPLRSVDLHTLSNAPATIERSDVCAVPAAAVVGEAMVALILADAFLEKFGGDSIEEIARHYDATAEQVRRRFTSRTTA
jgi:chorismate synthase